jgi:hypothetical protein
MTAEAYIQSVVDYVPPRKGLREQIAMELRSHIPERLEHGQPLDEVSRAGIGRPNRPRPVAAAAAAVLRSVLLDRRLVRVVHHPQQRASEMLTKTRAVGL